MKLTCNLVIIHKSHSKRSQGTQVCKRFAYWSKNMQETLFVVVKMNDDSDN